MTNEVWPRKNHKIYEYLLCYINSVIDKIVRKGEKDKFASVFTDLKTLLQLEPFIQLIYIEILN